MQQQTEAFRRDYRAVKAEIAKAIVGHEEIVDGVLTCLFVGGHALLEGVPGLGKTALVRALADRHVAKAQARELYEDLTPAPTAEEIETRRVERAYRAAMTPPRAPDKRQRRALRRMKGRED